MKPWPIYEAHVDGHAPALYCERTRDKARYAAFQEYRSNHWRCTFDDWLHMARLVRAESLPADPYGYIRDQYRVLVWIGDRVTFQDEPGLAGQYGVVIYPGAHASLVRVALPTGRAVRVHPLSIVRAA